MFGNILQPDECWMLNSRLPTVALRMNRQSKNAQRLAEALHGHRHSPGYSTPPYSTDPEQKRIYEKQCDYPGGIFSLDFKGGKKAAFEFLRRLRIAHNAVSLGGVETLTCHPKTTTHSGMTEEELAESGVTDGLVRVSVGIEDWRDLLADFDRPWRPSAEPFRLSDAMPALTRGRRQDVWRVSPSRLPGSLRATINRHGAARR